MGKYTKQQTEDLMKKTEKYKDIKINGKVIHILMWLAYRFDLAEGEMLKLQIKDVFQETNGNINILHLTFTRKTGNAASTTINVNFNAKAKLKLEKYYEYLENKIGFKMTKRAPVFPGKNGKRYCAKTLYRHMRKLGENFGAEFVTLKEIRRSKF